MNLAAITRVTFAAFLWTATRTEARPDRLPDSSGVVSGVGSLRTNGGD